MTFVIANWKMNFSRDEAIEFCNIISSRIDYKANYLKQLIIAPPALYLSHLAQLFPKLQFASQDVSACMSTYGAYTGEISAAMLQSCGIKYSIIGHCERKLYHSETYEQSRLKIEYCIAHDILPIICFGENLNSRQNNNYLEELKKQIIEILPRLLNSPFILAYEPVWAIGTAIIPSITELNEVYEFVNTITMSIAQPMAIVYGGSVNSTNVCSIIKSTKYNGVLLGKASLDKDELIKIMESVL